MTEHELKCWPPFFEDVVTGRKPFEVRNDDRNYQEGDMLHLREWDPWRETYTGRHTLRTVTYVLRGQDNAAPLKGVREGYVVMGLS